MKKIICLLTALSLAAASLTACTENEPVSGNGKKAGITARDLMDTDTSSEVRSDSGSEPSGSQADSSSMLSDPEPSSSEADTSSAAEPQNNYEGATPAMWEVTDDKGHTMTLCGSMHALSENDYPLPEPLVERFDAADMLEVECNINTEEAAKLSMSILSDVYYKDGDTVKDHISQEAWDALDAYFEDAGLDIDLYEKMKPWALDSIVEELFTDGTDIKSELGLDTYLIDKADEAGKQVTEAESVEFQLDLILGFSDEVYDFLFRSYEGYTLEQAHEELYALHDAWRAGNIDEVEDQTYVVEGLSEEDKAIFEEYNRLMLYDRNKGMEESIKDHLEKGDNVFFLVGAAHYAGDKGIISLLENDGYKVERIKY